MADIRIQSDLKSSLIRSEYEFVLGLITFYRRVELTSIAGTGLIVSIVVGAVAALWNADPNVRDEYLIANLMALEPWAQVLLLSLQVMALVRLRRASLYIKHQIIPLVNEPGAGPGVLGFENEDTRILVKHTFKPGFVVKFFTASYPLLLMNLLPAFAFTFAAWNVHPDQLRGEFVAFSLGASVIALVIAGVGALVSGLHEVETEQGRSSDEIAAQKQGRPGEISGAYAGSAEVTISAFGRSLAFFKKIGGKVGVSKRKD